MVFATPVFLFFYLPICLLVYLAIFAIGKKTDWRPRANLFLFLASLFFYTWGEQTLVCVLLFSTVVDYFCAQIISRKRAQGSNSRAALTASIVTNLTTLVIFKYFNFAADNLQLVLTSLGVQNSIATSVPHIALPLGISFYTFQSMSYSIDVYRGDVKATKSFIDFACYVSLFPQLVAGPIVRYRDVADDLVERNLSWDSFRSGVERFIVGLSKKVLLANTVATPVDTIFAQQPGNISMVLAWVGIVLYALQIYFDFSGYSDMAIGLGRMFGFRFPENFRHPYAARTFQDFWRRWHISLSTWFRDYLYIPLGGGRGSSVRVAFNLWAVFLLCGLWHGASWNFVAWGAMHGALLTLERSRFGGVLEKLPRVLQHAYVFVFLGITWAMFRAPDWAYTTDYLASMFGLVATSGNGMKLAAVLRPDVIVGLIAGIVAALPVVKLCQKRVSSAAVTRWLPRTVVPVLFMACVVRLAAGTYNPFIYFRF